MSDILFDGYFSSLRGLPITLEGYGITNASHGAWNEITNKPTTLKGYGITDAMSNTHAAYAITQDLINNWNDAYNSIGEIGGSYLPSTWRPTWSDITNTPTTLAGYGITDGGGGSTSYHNSLFNLDYASSGHIGFAPIDSPSFTTQIETPLTYSTLLYGSSVADGDLTIRGTSNATKTSSYVYIQDDGGSIGLATSSIWSGRSVSIGSGGLYSYGSFQFPLDTSIYLGSTNNTNQRLTFRTATSSGDVYIDYYNNLHLRSGVSSSADQMILSNAGIASLNGLHIGGTSDPGDNNLLVDGTSTFGDDLGTSTFFSGFAGSGWRLDKDTDYTLTIDNLIVRGTLTAYELDINKINSINGGIVVSVANGTCLTVSGTTIYFDEDNGHKLIQFAIDDYIRAQVWTGRGIASYVGHVTAVNHSNTYGSAHIVATTISGTPYDGMELVQIGSSSDTTRQNLIYITAADTNNPYIDMLAGVNDGSFAGKQKLRIGNLTGIIDSSFGGALSGYGLYADNVYLKGNIQITDGSVPNTVVTGLGSLATKSSVDLATSEVTNKSLANVDSTANTKLSGIAEGATVGATWGTNLYSIPATLGAPSGSGLFLSSTHLGYYTSSTWKTYMDNSGNLVLGDIAGGNTGLSWNQSAGTLNIKGTLTATAGYIGGWVIDASTIYTGTKYTSDGYSTGGITLDSNGAFHSKNFYIDSDGQIGIRGDQLIYGYVGVSDTIILSNDSQMSTNNMVWTKLKSITLGPYVRSNLTIRIYYAASRDDGGNVSTRIYRNGTAVGTEHIIDSTTSAIYSEDITGWNAGDVVELYAKTNITGHYVYVEWLRILGTLAAMVNEITGTNWNIA